MESIIDDQGDLFGVVNIVDALVVMMGVAVLTAGVALVFESVAAQLGVVGLGAIGLLGLARLDTEPTGEEDREESSRYLQLRISEIEPAVAEAITVGDTTLTDDLRVTDVSDEPASVVVETEDGTLVEQTHPRLRTVTLVATLHGEHHGNGDFRGDRLYVGREFRLDLDRVRVTATVVGLSAGQPDESPPDWTAVASGEVVSVSVAE
ncbi:MAG: DUF4330 domain-containing protein [Halobacteriales archaeon]